MDAAERSARLERLVQLQRQFLESALADAREILALVDSGARGGPAPHDMRLRKLAHDLRGTGAVYGFGALAQTAARLETAFSADEPATALRRCVEDLLVAVSEARDDLKILPNGLS
jgi:HPt (histidine-containing phosphotransfer) domain-containing protein